ncbi:MAG: hypothetical protein U9Q79_06375 [Candidatus Hydrogenedentes bacterium]|nr:hypothetical protein [Candidatus Hydrogenedentota bacterium]
MQCEHNMVWALPDTASGGGRQEAALTLRTKSDPAKSSRGILPRVLNTAAYVKKFL